MRFDNESQEKGLFTFYFQQGLMQQEHPTSPSNKKKTRGEPLPPLQDHLQSNKKKPKRSLQQQIDKHLSSRQHASRSKLESPKQRLMESVIDLTKDSKINERKQTHRPPPPLLRSRQFSLLIKAPEPFLSPECSPSSSHSKLNYIPELTSEVFNMQSIQRHKMTQKMSGCLSKPLHGPQEGVVELPSILRKEVKHEDRPRKSIKSKLIQEALHSGDRVRIKQIRQYLHNSSPVSPEPKEKEGSKSMRVFQLRQEKLIEILRRFRKD